MEILNCKFTNFGRILKNIFSQLSKFTKWWKNIPFLETKSEGKNYVVINQLFTLLQFRVLQTQSELM